MTTDKQRPWWGNLDTVVACADLTGRAGALGFEIGYLHRGVPIEQAGWWARANYRGLRISVEDRRSPVEAGTALAERLLRGGQCRCALPVTLLDGVAGCRWRLMGRRWEPGCTAPPLVGQRRGDLAELEQLMAERAAAGPPAGGPDA